MAKEGDNLRPQIFLGKNQALIPMQKFIARSKLYIKTRYEGHYILGGT